MLHAGDRAYNPKVSVVLKALGVKKCYHYLKRVQKDNILLCIVAKTDQILANFVKDVGVASLYLILTLFCLVRHAHQISRHKIILPLELGNRGC